MISDRSYSVFRPLIIGFCKCLFFIKIEGKENIPKEGGYIICSNHRSNFDPFFIAGYLPLLPHFMAKEELFEVPLLGGIIRFFRAFPIRRGKNDVSAIDMSIKVVEQGGSLLMFPEGTRSKTGALLKPKSGVALIASASGRDILPCAVATKGKVRPFKRVVVRFGPMIPNEAIRVEGKSASMLRASSKLIMGRIAELLDGGAPAGEENE